MNRIYCVVWHAASGTLAAAAASARRGSHRPGCGSRSGWTLAIGMCVATPSVLAQSVSVATGTAASTYVTHGGVTVVDIARPDPAGLSHNRYERFHVNAAGLILNNGVAAGTSQLAGRLDANPHLAEGNARAAGVILNEVVDHAPSVLAGLTEVAGARADVVLANPHGITCAGCGFLNTTRVTLSTGVPYLDASGGLAGFDIGQGQLSIEKAGLDANDQWLQLLARAIKVDAVVRAGELVAVAGASRVDRNGQVLGKLAGSGPAEPFALDSTALGGMHAGKIALVSTEAGSGVRLRGAASATQAGFRVEAEGRILVAGQLEAAKDLSLHAGESFVNEGAIRGDDHIHIRAPSVENVAAGADAGTWLYGADSMDRHGRPTQTRHFLYPPSMRAATIHARHAVTLDVGRRGRNVGGTVTGGNAVVLTGQAADGSTRFLNQGVLEETQLHGSAWRPYRATFLPRLAARIEAPSVRATNLALENRGTLTATHTQAAVIAGQEVQLHLQSLANMGGTIAGTRRLEVTTRGDIVNESGDIEGGAVALRAQGNVAHYTSPGTVRWNQEYESGRGPAATIAAADGLTLEAGGQVRQYGADLLAGGRLTLRGARGILVDTAQASFGRTSGRRAGNGVASTDRTETQSFVRHRRARVFAGDGLTLSTRGDAILAGAIASVFGEATMRVGTLNIMAREDVTRTEASHSARGLGVDGSLYGRKTSASTTEARQPVGTILHGYGGLSVHAAGDVDVTGAWIDVSGAGTIVSEGGQVRLGAGLGRAAYQGQSDTLHVLRFDASRQEAGVRLAGADGRQGAAEKRTATPARLSVGADLTLRAEGGAIGLLGSLVESHGDMTVRARDVVLDALATRHRSAASDADWALGWMARADAEGQARGDASLGSRANRGKGPHWKADQPDWMTLRGRADASFRGALDLFRSGSTGQVARESGSLRAGLTAGGGLQVEATGKLMTRASTMAAGATMRLAAHDIETLAGGNESRHVTATRDTTLGWFLTLGASAQGGLGALGDGEQPMGLPSANVSGEGGMMLAHGESERLRAASVAVVSILRAGGNLERVAQGNLRDVGTHVEAGGDLVQTANRIASEAAEEQDQSATDSRTQALRAGIYGSVSVGLPQYRPGEGASAARTGLGAGAGGVLGYRQDAAQARDAASRPVAALLKARNVSSTSSAGTTLAGTVIEASGDVRIRARSLDYRVARGSARRDSSDAASGGDLRADKLNHAISLSVDHRQGQSSRSEQTAQVGRIHAGGALMLKTDDGMTLEGSELLAGGNMDLIALAGDLTYRAFSLTRERSEDHHAGNGSATLGAGFAGAEGGHGAGSTRIAEALPLRGGMRSEQGSIYLAGGLRTMLAGTRVAAPSGKVDLRGNHGLFLKAVYESGQRHATRTDAHAGVGNLGVSSGGGFHGVRMRDRVKAFAVQVTARDAIRLFTRGDAWLEGPVWSAPTVRKTVWGGTTEVEVKPEQLREKNDDAVVPGFIAPLRAARGRAPTMRRAGLMAGGAQGRYDQRFVFLLGADDAATGLAARRLADKHAGTQMVRVGRDGKLLDPLLPGAAHGRVKFTMVGHGDGKAATLGGMGPSEMADLVSTVMQRNPRATLAKLNLAGCDTECMTGPARKALQKRGLEPVVTGEEGLAKIDGAGHKVGAKPGDTQSLGGGVPARHPPHVDADEIESHIFDRMRRQFDPDQAADEEAQARRRVADRGMGWSTAGEQRLLARLSTEITSPRDDDGGWHTAMARALHPLPDFEGTTYLAGALPVDVYGKRIVRGDVVASRDFLPSLASVTQIQEYVAELVPQVGAGEEKPVFIGIEGKRGKPVGAYAPDNSEGQKSLVMFPRGVKFKVRDIRDTPDVTYVWFAETDEATHGIYKDPASGAEHRDYRHRMVVPLESDSAVKHAAERLANKHADTIAIPLGADGRLDLGDTRLTRGGSRKISLVGHGEPEKLGGKSVAELADLVQQVNRASSPCKVSLVGCNSIPLGVSLQRELTRRGVHAQVRGTYSHVAVADDGSVFPIDGNNPDALGAGGR